MLTLAEALLSSAVAAPDPALVLCADTGKQISLSGTVSGYEKKTNSAGYLLSACILIDSDQKYPLDSKIYLYADDDTIPIGSVILVKGRLSLPEAASNPGQFDGVSYYHQKGVSAIFFAREVSVLAMPRFLSPMELARRLKNHLADVLEEICTGESLEILQAMLLGDKTELRPDTRALFQNGGILHILTISGMHLYLFGMGLYALLIFLRIPNTPAIFLAFGLLWFYILMTGCGTAVLRAGIMFTVLLGGKLFGRTYDQATALAVAVFLLLCCHPSLVFNSSFQLSVTAILGSSIFLPGFTEQSEKEKEAERTSLRKRRNHRIEKIRKKLLQAVSSALVLQAVMLPLILYYFYELPVYSLVATLILLPGVSWLMVSAAAGLAAGLLLVPAGSLLILPAVWMLKGYHIVLSALSALPASSLILGRPRIWQIGLYELTLLTLMSLARAFGGKKPAEWFPCKFRSVCLLCIPFLMFLLLPGGRNQFSITLLDVGQGDGILIQSNGNACMIDGGSSDEKQIGSYVLSPALRSQGIGRLSAVFLTHPDADHVNGITEILEQIAAGTENLQIDTLCLPEWMKENPDSEWILQAARSANVPLCFLKSGDRIRIGDSLFTVLHPGREEADAQQDPNSACLVLKLENQGFTALFTGDLPSDRESALTETFACDFLKIAHHGSEFSTGEQFLSAYHPQIAAFSCGKNNRYGHPSAKTLCRLHDAGTLVYGTVQSGALRLYRKRGNYYMEGFLDSEPYSVI